MIWREKMWLLVGLGALLLANVIYFQTYRVRYSERVTALENRLEDATAELETARARRVAAQREIEQYREVTETIETVYSQWWSTPEQRLSPLIVEMRTLARRSQMIPKTISYDHTDQQRDGATTSLGISFGVQGTYRQIRALINMIELSKQFVIIDEIALSESGESGSSLQLNLRLKTLFRAPERNTRNLG